MDKHQKRSWVRKNCKFAADMPMTPDAGVDVSNLKIVSEQNDDYVEPNEDYDGRRMGNPIQTVRRQYVMKGMVQVPEALLQSMPGVPPQDAVTSLIGREFDEYGGIPLEIQESSGLGNARGLKSQYKILANPAGPGLFDVTVNVTIRGDQDYSGGDDGYHDRGDPGPVSDGPLIGPLG